MNIGGLGILNRTSSRLRLNLLSWHSPHSLTWRWIVSVGRQPLWTLKPYMGLQSMRYGHGGLAIGLGQLIALRASRDNNGWQFAATFLWHALEFSQQKPVWYRDIYMRQRDNELEQDFASQRPQPIVVPDHPTLQ